MDLQNPKGTRDFFPEEKIMRDEIISILKETFEIYGYNPLETPALESYETLSSKYAGGAEILKEVYTLEDNAKRKLGLRYDLTVPFARFIASNPEIKKPFKRYQIDRVWRDGPIKLGRYREFYQCDADIVGTSSLVAEAELLSMAAKFFKAANLEVTFYVNNRKLMNALLEFANIQQEKQADAILSIDKLKKIGADGVREELLQKGMSEESVAKLLAVFSLQAKSNDELIKEVEGLVQNSEGLKEVRSLLEYCKLFSLDNVVLDITLARGLSYYTGSVYEAFLKDGSISSSLAGGGRYDKMIGQFMESKEDMPAVGISFGLEPILDALKLQKKLKGIKTVVRLYILPIGTQKECIKIMTALRAEGVRCEMDLAGRGMMKNLDYASKMGIPYVLFVGENELKTGKYNLKNMQSGKEISIALERIPEETKRE